jgi:hypothetical protein
MDQGVIATFKAYYIRKTFSQAVKTKIVNEGVPTLKEFWRSYNVREAVGIICNAWDEVKSQDHVWGMEATLGRPCSGLQRF